MRVRVRACVRACARARACVLTCVRACVCERERENSQSKTLYYKDCTIDSVKTLQQLLVFAKLLVNENTITGHHLYKYKHE